MRTAAKRQLLSRVIADTLVAGRSLHDLNEAVRDLYDPELNEHLVICELARRHLAQRATDLLVDLDDNLDGLALEEAANA